MGRRHGAIHGATRLNHRQHRGAVDGCESPRHAAQSESGGRQLYSESRCLHSGERLGRRPLWHAACFCARGLHLHDFLVFCGLAMNVPQMVAARIIQGMGAR